MAKVKVNKTKDSPKSMRPALTPEARENQLTALAVDVAEEQLRNGTASSQVICHYLKLAATKEERKLNREIQEKQKELMEAKAENLKAQKRSEELFEEAIKAFRGYSGQGGSDEY